MNVLLTTDEMYGTLNTFKECVVKNDAALNTAELEEVNKWKQYIKTINPVTILSSEALETLYTSVYSDSLIRTYVLNLTFNFNAVGNIYQHNANIDMPEFNARLSLTLANALMVFGDRVHVIDDKLNQILNMCAGHAIKDIIASPNMHPIETIAEYLDSNRILVTILLFWLLHTY